MLTINGVSCVKLGSTFVFREQSYAPQKIHGSTIMEAARKFLKNPVTPIILVSLAGYAVRLVHESPV